MSCSAVTLSHNDSFEALTVAAVIPENTDAGKRLKKLTSTELHNEVLLPLAEIQEALQPLRASFVKAETHSNLNPIHDVLLNMLNCSAVTAGAEETEKTLRQPDEKPAKASDGTFDI